MRFSRYYMLFLLFLINVLSYIDRHMLPAYASQIIADLELTRQQFGLLTGFAFVTVYAISGPLMGVLADRYEPSRVIACGLFVWSLMTSLTGLAKNFLQVLIPRMVIGVGEATLHPGAAGIIGRLFDPSRRATVFGLFFMGSQIGLGLAYWLAGHLGDRMTWREMFYILGALGVVMCLLLVPYMKVSGGADKNSVSQERDNRSIKVIVGELFHAFKSEPNFRSALISLSLLHMLYASTQFTQLWLVADKGFSETDASSLYGRMFLLSAVPSSLLGGLAADWFCKKFKSTKSMFVALVVLICTPLLITFRLSSPDSPWFFIGMSASVCMLTFPYGAMFSLILDNAPKRIQSTAVGFTMFIANVMIIGSGTYMIGLIGDVLEARHVADFMTIAMLVADAIAISAMFFYYALHRATRPMPST